MPEEHVRQWQLGSVKQLCFDPGAQALGAFTYVALMKVEELADGAGPVPLALVTADYLPSNGKLYEEGLALSFSTTRVGPTEELKLTELAAGIYTQETEAFDNLVRIDDDTWFLYVARKAAGTNKVQFSIYDFDAETWTHHESTEEISDPPDITGGKVVLGGVSETFEAEEFPTIWEGFMAAVAIYDRVLTTGAVEALVTKEAVTEWKATTPLHLWILDTVVVKDEMEDAEETTIFSGAEQPLRVKTEVPMTLRGGEGEEEEEEEPEEGPISAYVLVGGELVPAKSSVLAGGSLVGFDYGS